MASTVMCLTVPTCITLILMITAILPDLAHGSPSESLENVNKRVDDSEPQSHQQLNNEEEDGIALRDSLLNVKENIDTLAFPLYRDTRSTGDNDSINKSKIKKSGNEIERKKIKRKGKKGNKNNDSKQKRTKKVSKMPQPKPKACKAKKKCKINSGVCQPSSATCDGKIIPKGCKGGKKCACCASDCPVQCPGGLPPQWVCGGSSGVEGSAFVLETKLVSFGSMCLLNKAIQCDSAYKYFEFKHDGLCICQLQKVMDKCNDEVAETARYYYNWDEKRCVEFSFDAGCSTNANNFETYYDCWKTCATFIPGSRTTMKPTTI